MKLSKSGPTRALRSVFGEVESGEFAEEFLGFAVVGTGGFDGVVVVAYVGGAAVAADRRFVLSAVALPGDAFEEGTASVAPAVAHVLGVGAVAKVPAAVVERAAVDVVDDHALRRLADLAVHVDRLSVFAAAGVQAVGAGDAPPAFAQRFVVGGIDDGEPVVGQRDEANLVVGRVRRVGVNDGAASAAEVGAAATGLDAGNAAGPVRRVRADPQDPPALPHARRIHAVPAARPAIVSRRPSPVGQRG